MECFFELTNDDVMLIDGGADVGEALAYASAALASGSLANACIGALETVSVASHALVVTGCIAGALGFGVITIVCATGAIIALTE